MVGFTRVPAGLLAAGVALLLATGCTASPRPTTPGGPTLRAAEPAVAPSPTVAPAGRVVPVGDQAEGIVADPVTHVVAVGVRDPDRLVLLDGRRGTRTAEVTLPGHVRHLDLAEPGGPVLVPDEDSGRLLSVGLPGGSVLSTVSVGTYPHAATRLADGTLAVADEQGGAVVLVRAGRVVHRFTDVAQPGGVAASGDRLGVVDVGRHTLSFYDAQSLERLAIVGAGAGPTHVVADRQERLQVIDTTGGNLLTFDTRPALRLTVVTPLGAAPYGIAYDRDRDRLWVTLTGQNRVVGVDLGRQRPTVDASLPTVRQPNTVAVDAQTGRVFVASRTDGTVQLIDPPAVQ